MTYLNKHTLATLAFAAIWLSNGSAAGAPSLNPLSTTVSMVQGHSQRSANARRSRSASKQHRTKPVTVPTDWQRVEGCGVIFYLPADFTKIAVLPIDSCILQYRTSDTLINLDVYGAAARGESFRRLYEGKAEFTYRRRKVDRQAGEILTFLDPKNSEDRPGPYMAILFVPVMPNRYGNVNFWGQSKDAVAREVVLKIFRTIRFTRN